jgi:hypothetical protein
MSSNHPVDLFGTALPATRRMRRFRAMFAPAPNASQVAVHNAPETVLEPSITVQAHDIIETVLADSDPRLADIQRSLRESVAIHPGCPSSALLAHLLKTRQRTNSGL